MRRYAELAAATAIVAQARRGPAGGLVLRADAWPPTCPTTRRCCARRSSARCWRVTACADVEHACDVVDSLPFALTGGLFSRSPATVEHVARRAPVGNLYVNRGITGAMVGRQPFGGNRRSGIGSKAGGPDYLLQFVEPRVVTENTMRHGIPSMSVSQRHDRSNHPGLVAGYIAKALVPGRIRVASS